jgi:hypothetical protein
VTRVVGGSSLAKLGTAFALNAGRAINQLVPAKDRDKTIAQMFGCSVRMAKYRRGGRCWTLDRLQTASALFGQDFDVLLIVPLQHAVESLIPAQPEEIHERIDRLEDEVAAMRNQLRGNDEQ